MALLVMTTGIALGATQFTGKLQEVTITDAAKTNIPPTPVLKYTLNGNAITVDASGSFDTDGSITQYHWDFGDGTKATGVTVNHQYAASGSYPLTLTVIDNAGGAGIAQQLLDLATQSTLFYWSVDKLPQATSILSDSGNVTITRALNDATSAPGIKGNCMQQTGGSQFYQIPMAVVPAEKGKITMYVQHAYGADTDPANRYFFTSAPLGQGTRNCLHAYTLNGNIFFIYYDSSGTFHRVFGKASWETGKWYKYEFSWDIVRGHLGINRDGTVLMENTESAWQDKIASWKDQTFFIGNFYPLGKIDEITIQN